MDAPLPECIFELKYIQKKQSTRRLIDREYSFLLLVEPRADFRSIVAPAVLSKADRLMQINFPVRIFVLYLAASRGFSLA